MKLLGIGSRINHPELGFGVVTNVTSEYYWVTFQQNGLETIEIDSDFEIIAQTDQNIIMGIAHKKFYTYGVQFHPESIGTKVGKTILNNYLKIINYAN